MDREVSKEYTDKMFKALGFYISVFVLAVIFVFFVVKIVRTPQIELRWGENEIVQGEDRNYRFPVGNIKKGIYSVEFEYEAESNANIDLTYQSNVHNPIYADDEYLESWDNCKSFDFWANWDTDNVGISIYSGEGKLNIRSAVIKTAANSRIYSIAKLVLLYLLIALVYFGVAKKKYISEHSQEIAILAILVFVSSIGLFTRYLYSGHDLNFHLMRIEDLKNEMSIGNLNPYVMPNWCYKWGYCVSAMYGNLMLYLPAFMRLLGFTLITSYKTFLVFVNLATALSAFLCFSKMSKDKTAVYVATALYVLSPYRLCCIYLRAAFGEYCAFIFLPMIALGFYRAFCEDSKAKEYGKKFIIPAIGFACLIRTHLLSCIMSAVFIGLLCLINIKKVFVKETFLYLLKIALSALVMSLGFLVPFLRFMKEPLSVMTRDLYMYNVQYWGCSITELFAQKISPGTYFNFGELTGLNNRMTTAPGNGLFVILIAFFLARTGKKEKSTRTVKILVALGFAALFTATIYFPYSYIYKNISKALYNFINKGQLPYRYITIAVILFSISIVFVLPRLAKLLTKEVYAVVIAAALLIGLDQSLGMIAVPVYSGSVYVRYDGSNLQWHELIGYEYLYSTSDLETAKNEHEVTGNDLTVNSYSNEFNKYVIDVETYDKAGEVFVPLFAYPGYRAIDEANEVLKLERSNQNRIKITVPSDYCGKIYVEYKKKPIWILSEIVSLLAVAAFIVIEHINSKKIGKEDDR